MSYKKIIIWILAVFILSSIAWAECDTACVTNLNGKTTWYHDFETLDGSLLDDLTSTGHDASIDGADATTDGNCVIGECYDFVKANTDKINFTNNQDLKAFCIWVNSSYPSASSIGTFVTFDSADTDKIMWIGSFSGDWDNELISYIQKSSAPRETTFINTSSVPSISTGWQFICTNWTGTRYEIIINATQHVNYDLNGGADDLLSSTPVWYGYYDAGGTYDWDNRLDEGMGFNDSLTGSQIEFLYNNGTPTSDQQFPFVAAFSNNFTITAVDEWNGTTLQVFNTSIDGVTYNTTNGTIYTPYLQNDTSTHNVSVWADDYFNRSYLNFNISSNLKAVLHQAEICFNATEKVSDSGVTADNYSISGNSSASCFNISSGSHNVTFAALAYYPNLYSFSISAGDNTTETVTGVYSGQWNISVYNIINNALITAYDINITSLNYTSWTGENSSSTTGSYNFSGINGTYQAIIDAAGYVPQTFNFTINGALGGVNFSLYTTNSVNITVYDEETQSILSGYNVSIEFIGETYSANYSTMNGTLYVDLLTPQVYLIRYVDTNSTYGERHYYFNLSNRTNTAIDLYLLKNSTYGYAAITATVYDETNHFVEGAIIKALRYYLNTNSYVIVDMGKTNFEGVTSLNLKQNEEFYKFIIEYPMGTTKKTTEPTQIYADTLNFQILLGTETGARFYKGVDTIANVTFDETNNWFRLEWNDPENTLSRICMHTNEITNFRNTTVNRTCSTSAAGVMYHPVQNITGRTYHAQALAYYSDPPVPIAAAYHTFKETNPIGTIGLFILIIVTIAFMFTGKWSIPVAVILTPLPTMLASIAEIVPIPAYVSVPIEIVACIVAYVISTRA